MAGCRYQYTSLPDRHIRLLRIHSDMTNAYRLHGKFTCVNLDNPGVSYQTVSYVWGNPAPRDKVWFEDRSFLEVTASAASILRRLTAQHRGYIWIDTLCINQQDEEEKSCQVQMMYDIYRSAEAVQAWVGETSTDTVSAMEFTKQLHRNIGIIYQLGFNITVENLTVFNGCEHTSPDWTRLALLLDSPLFRRVWILQEMVAAKTCHLTCGGTSIDLDMLLSVVVLLFDTPMDHLLSPVRNGIRVLDAVNPINTIFAIRHAVKAGEAPPGLAFQLLHFHSFQATDPRDLIFALLNLSADRVAKQLIPDYSLSTHEVYTRTVLRLLHADSSSVCLLGAAGEGWPRSLTGLPSWVPDFSTLRRASPLATSGDASVQQYEYSFRAAGTTALKVVTEGKLPNYTLTVTGRIIDNIHALAEPFPNLSPLISLRLEWLLNVLALVKSSKLYETYEDGIPSVILVAGLLINNSEDVTNSHFQTWFALYCIDANFTSDPILNNAHVPISVRRKIMDMRHTPLLDSIDDRPPVCASENAHGQSPRFPSDPVCSASQFESRLLDAMGARRIFVTENGFVGQGPPLSRDGDLLCLIYGSNVPFVIRPRKEGGYILVGECYLHRAMHGERLEEGREMQITLY